MKVTRFQIEQLWWLLFVLPVALACAEASPAGDGCECGVYEGSCIPCPEGDDRIDVPDDDLGDPFLNQERIDEQQGYFLNQEGDGRFTIYVNEDTEIGVRVVNYFGNPSPGIPVSFQLLEPDPTNPSGVQLRSQTAQSNDFGVAKISLRGGADPAFVKLQMSATNTAGLTYEINVVQRPNIDAPNPGPGGMVNPGGPQCLRTKGTYDLVNLYQPASLLGDDFNNAMMTINRALTDPGSYVADAIADNIGRIGAGIIRQGVNYLFRLVVDRHLPDWAQRVVYITTDLTTALTALEIRGTMELGDENQMDCTLQGIHRWETLVFVWRANCPPNDDQCGRIEIPMNALGIAASETPFDAVITEHGFTGDLMEIAEHRLQMNIGVAVIWFLERTVLPQYFNGVNSIGDLLAMVIPCDALGDIVADAVSIPFVPVRSIVRDACRAGLREAGNALSREIADRLSIDTFDMAGECRLKDRDNNQTVDKIEDGVWSGQLDGTFSGERRGQQR